MPFPALNYEIITKRSILNSYYFHTLYNKHFAQLEALSHLNKIFIKPLIYLKVIFTVLAPKPGIVGSEIMSSAPTGSSSTAFSAKFVKQALATGLPN